MPKREAVEVIVHPTSGKLVWAVYINVEPAYTLAMAARIAVRSSQWVRSQVEKGRFLGENSTPETPVDHDKLEQYLKERQLKDERREALKEAFRMSQELGL